MQAAEPGKGALVEGGGSGCCRRLAPRCRRGMAATISVPLPGVLLGPQSSPVAWLEPKGHPSIQADRIARCFGSSPDRWKSTRHTLRIGTADMAGPNRIYRMSRKMVNRWTRRSREVWTHMRGSRAARVPAEVERLLGWPLPGGRRPSQQPWTSPARNPSAWIEVQPLRSV